MYFSIQSEGGTVLYGVDCFSDKFTCACVHDSDLVHTNV